MSHSVARRVKSALLAWYDEVGRLLPWRTTHNPYEILVSEVMLQQTQVPRVLLFYKMWLTRFPNWRALARSSNADVLHAWAGLGYNRRALILLNIARQIVERGVPRCEEEWRVLKGIGPYTAAAIALFSGREATIPIDTNIRRVWGRVLLGKLFPSLREDEKLKKKLRCILEDEERQADMFQATFDLATSICTKQPHCATCPLKNVCPASKKFLSGNVKTPKRTTPIAHETIHRNKKYPDRIYRGRILKLVRESDVPIKISRIGSRIDSSWSVTYDSIWLNAMLQRMQKDGMISIKRDTIVLHE